MGYTTQFQGQFTVTPALAEKHRVQLDAFARKRQSNGPSEWCQWIPSSDGTGIGWDGVEKFYGYVEWLQYLINKLLRPWGYELSGEVEFRGEDLDDVGVLRVENNKVKVARFEEVLRDR